MDTDFLRGREGVVATTILLLQGVLGQEFRRVEGKIFFLSPHNKPS